MTQQTNTQLDHDNFFLVNRIDEKNKISIKFLEEESNNLTFRLKSEALYHYVSGFIERNPNTICYQFFLEIFDSILDYYKDNSNLNETNYKKELKHYIYNDLNILFLNNYGFDFISYTLNDHFLDDKIQNKKSQPKSLYEYGIVIKDLIRDLIYFHSDSIYHFIHNKNGTITEKDKLYYFINIHLTRIVNFSLYN